MHSVLTDATPFILIPYGYASTTSPCVLSYILLNSNRTQYTGLELSIDSTTGAVSIIRDILFSVNLMIEVTSSDTSSTSLAYSSTFTVDQVCGSYCTPTFNGIASSYSLNV